MQNTSHAVMSQRVEPHDSLDFFPTPAWGTRALIEHIGISKWDSAWEPACGQGHMSKVLAETFPYVYSSDVHDYGYGAVRDFMTYKNNAESKRRADWIITNPPFNLAEQFALTAMQRANAGVALLVRTSFLESVGRYERLFKPFPPHSILQFTERLPMHKGRVDPKGSTATSYCWLTWIIGSDETLPLFRWIPPCRKRLERAEDYFA